MRIKKKMVSLVVAVSLVMGCLLGGTLAWLTDKTVTVTNTFTVGNIDITLTETTGDEYKMIPGNTLAKDPKVTVKADSEDCWLFVKVEEKDPVVANKNYKLTDFIKYEIADDWTELDETAHPGVYYREVSAANEAQNFAVLKDNTVTVKSDVTKQMMDDLEKAGKENYPELIFTAYAVQKDNIDIATAAWAEIK